METRADTQLHNFDESLRLSHSAADLPIWEEMYRRAFSPNFLGMFDHRQDGDHQRHGIDRSVILKNSVQILIDEKVRGRSKNGRIYEDILLEYWSDEERQVPGWVCKPLLCQYIAYAIAPLGVGYLLPVIQLQQAWLKYGEEWKKTCPKIVAPNHYNGRSWNTISVGVAARVLFPKIGEALRIGFTPVDF